MVKGIAFIFAMLLIFGCSDHSQPQGGDGVPKWLYNPGMSGNMGGVGSARTHLKGKSAQRKLAISRALDEIAVQMGVKVSNILASQSSADGSSASSSMDTYSFQTTDGKIVKAKIKEMWYDETKEELHVWMVVE